MELLAKEPIILSRIILIVFILPAVAQGMDAGDCAYALQHVERSPLERLIQEATARRPLLVGRIPIKRYSYAQLFDHIHQVRTLVRAEPPAIPQVIQDYLSASLHRAVARFEEIYRLTDHHRSRELLELKRYLAVYADLAEEQLRRLSMGITESAPNGSVETAAIESLVKEFGSFKSLSLYRLQTIAKELDYLALQSESDSEALLGALQQAHDAAAKVSAVE